MKDYNDDFSQLIDQSEDLFWIMGLDFNFIYVSPAIEYATGYTPSEMIGKSLKLLLTKESFDKIVDLTKNNIKMYTETPRVESLEREEENEFQYIHKNGQIYWLRVSSVFVRDEDGYPKHVIGNTHFIERQKKFERELIASELKYRQLFENLPVGALVFDENGNILDLNNQILHILGSPSIEATKKINLLTFPLLVKSGISEDIRKSIETQSYVNNNKEYTSKWGKSVRVRYHISPLILENETQFHLLVEDITTVFNAQEQLIEAQKMDSIGNLVGGIAHDFNNMLAGILGYTSLLESVEVNTEKLEYISGISKAASRAHELTQKLLAFGQRGKNLVLAVDVNEIIKEVMVIIKSSINPYVIIKSSYSDNLVSIDADPSQINQIIMNLLINASEAIEKSGEICVETKNIRIDEHNSIKDYKETDLNPTHVKLLIKDNGIGIDEEGMKHIFEPYYSTKESGKGLGLATVYGIVQNHGGEISVKSELRQGTEFKIIFPKGEKIKEKLTEKTKLITDIEKTRKILIIDDEDIVRGMLKNMLERLGYSVEEASNGLIGKNYYELNYLEIDLVILDLLMPVMDGEVTFNHLLEINPEVKVILTTGFGQNETAQRILDIGAIDLLAKPYSIETLSKCLDKYID